MDRSHRPSSHPPRSPALDSARGTFREALAALRNLSALIRSRKVGPKPILNLVPDVRVACEPLTAATLAVIEAIESDIAPSAVDALRTFLAERISMLGLELEAAEKGSMSARQRLHLEQALDKLLWELDGSRSLLGLLESAVYEQTLPIDLVELLLQSHSGPPSGAHVRTITARVQGNGRDIGILQPRTLAALLAGAVELLAEHGQGTPQISLSQSARGWSAEVALSQAPAGQLLTVSGYGLVPPTLPCLEAAAARLGIDFSWQPEVPLLTLHGRR